jgi:hypothetical protein
LIGVATSSVLRLIPDPIDQVGRRRVPWINVDGGWSYTSRPKD